MVELARFVVCPETLEPLEPRADEFWSPRAGRGYPVREGIVFFGYPERDQAMIEETMAEEHAWQGTAETVQRDTQFLRESSPRAVDLINLASQYVRSDGSQPRALELGAGSGWVSWLLAMAGYDTWTTDFEANSVAIGMQYEHPNLGAGRRFVCDARYPPFADGTFDMVLLKEFVHHVADFDLLFAEANRVLRPGGILTLMEPTQTVWRAVQEWRSPDDHQGHAFSWLDAYLSSLKRNGFAVEHETAVYAERDHRFGAIKALKQRAARSVQGLQRPGLFTQAHLRLIGDASNIVIARKTADAARQERPRMQVIDPATLVIGDDERAAFRQMIPVLEQVAPRLHPVVGAPADGTAA